jgi:hypothetical protein
MEIPDVVSVIVGFGIFALAIGGSLWMRHKVK